MLRTDIDRYVQALTLDPEREEFWHSLGNCIEVEGTVQIGSQSYTKNQCYVQALTLYPKYVEAWHSLGNSLGLGEWAQIGSQIYTQRQCFLQAETLDPKLISPASLSTLGK